MPAIVKLERSSSYRRMIDIKSYTFSIACIIFEICSLILQFLINKETDDES